MHLVPQNATHRRLETHGVRRALCVLAMPLVAMTHLAAHADEPEDASPPPELVFVHMSDTHLATGVENPGPRHPLMPHSKDLERSADWLEAAVAMINDEIEPDFVVITGDVVDGAARLPADIERTKAILDELDCPYYVTIGNHDRRAESEFLDIFEIDRNYAFTYGRWRFIALDGSRSVLSEHALALLQEELAAAADAEKRVAVLNHYPLSVPQWVLDVAAVVYPRQLTVQNADAALKLLDEHDHVRLVLAGHIHHELEHERRGVPHVTTGALIKRPHRFRVVRIRGDEIDWQPREVRLPETAPAEAAPPASEPSAIP